jgi:outer membrane protein assembly factor BamB
MKIKTLSFILLIFISGFVMAQDISEWREENRTGVSAETGLLKSWPAAGPVLLWSNLQLTKGYSSVSFGNNLIYITGIKGDNDLLFALDRPGLE